MKRFLGKTLNVLNMKFNNEPVRRTPTEMFMFVIGVIIGIGIGLQCATYLSR